MCVWSRCFLHKVHRSKCDISQFKMDKIEVYNEDSSDSIKEMEPPKKLPPPLIDLTSEDTVETEKRRASPAIFVTIHENIEISQSSAEDNPSHWTNDMIKFYNDDWGNESNFDVAKIQSKMDKDPSLWHVSQRDLLFMRNRKIRSRAKCWNCCQFGHTVYHCKEKLQIVKCHMCGGAGHMEETCPSSICLTCGTRMAIFVLSCFKCIPEAKSFCSRCYLTGHNIVNCTDNWRRFHSTIGTTTVDIPKSSAYKTPKELWCCNCGKKGHNQINCTKSKDATYPDTFPFVASYVTNFNSDIYSASSEEPVASTSTSREGSRDNLQSMDKRAHAHKSGRNLSKLHKKKRKRKKKKNKDKANRRHFTQIPNFFSL